jgi:hypothetical protein
MDGNVSKEEVHRRQESGEIVTETHKVWVPDPTPALFDSWALAGWGGSLAEPARSTYQGHVAQKANREFLIAVVLTLPLSGARIPFRRHSRGFSGSCRLPHPGTYAPDGDTNRRLSVIAGDLIAPSLSMFPGCLQASRFRYTKRKSRPH